MEYFYLDSTRTPQGPHTLEELSQMLRDGKLSPDTEVATKGADQWKALHVILSESELPPTQPTNGVEPEPVGPCPHCHAQMTLNDEGVLPQNCPICQQQLRPTDFSFWACIVSAFTQCTNFKGRATRAEYWFFYLFNCLICAPIHIIAECSDSEELSLVFSLISCLVGLAFFLPGLSLSVRRLHDSGRSGKLILWFAGTYIGGIIFAILFAVIAMASLSETNPILIIVLAIIGGGLLFASLILAIYLCICMFFDSDRGANRFGPSSKYPLVRRPRSLS